MHCWKIQTGGSCAALAKMQWRKKRTSCCRSFTGGSLLEEFLFCCGLSCTSAVKDTKGDQESVWESHKGEMGDSEILAYACLCMGKIEGVIPNFM